MHGDNVEPDNTGYFISTQILGHAVKFSGTVLDYFDSHAEPTQFRAECIKCRVINNFIISLALSLHCFKGSKLSVLRPGQVDSQLIVPTRMGF